MIVSKKLFSAILAKGYILIEDVPGVGKTTLATAFSKTQSALLEVMEEGKVTVDGLEPGEHAWVEIFLEEIGWVPIEVTTVYQGTSDDNGKIPQKEINQDPQGKTQETQQEERKESESQTQIEEWGSRYYKCIRNRWSFLFSKEKTKDLLCKNTLSKKEIS